MAVIATFDLDNLVAARCSTCNAQRVHRGFGARVGEAPQREAVTRREQLGHFGVAWARGDKQCSVIELSRHGLAHGGVHVAGEQRAKAHVVVHVAIAVDVNRPVLLGASQHDRVRVVVLKAGWHAEGHRLAGAGVSRLGTFGALGVNL